MKLGVQYQRDGAGLADFARRAEAAGLDSVWCGDHVGHLYDGIAALGCYAGATRSITIGLNVLVAPYRPAAVMAKALATIAHIAPGRVVAGFGVGGEFPNEFVATGADRRARGAYTDEALEVILELWQGEAVTHEGRFVRLDRFRLTPRPDPRPVVWIGGRSEAALRRAVRFGDAYAPYLVSPDQVARRRSRIEELAAEAGRSLEGFQVGCLVTVVPAPTVEAAIERGIDALALSGLSPETMRNHYLLGDDRSLVERVAEYRAAGVDHLILGCLPGSDRDLDEFFAKVELIRTSL
jgi:alkanesulfonate monooxygenase SsuD/methylene tetrahydromethanopterin reductase-like flavin-dependent oxidoreductase (luciferase family)